MALTSEKEVQQANGSVAEDGSHADTEFPTPYLGRSVRIVDKVVNVDMSQSPHPKNSRGELGKPLFNWYNNTVSKDPLTRVTAPNHFADRRHFLSSREGTPFFHVRWRTLCARRHRQGRLRKQ